MDGSSRSSRFLTSSEPVPETVWDIGEAHAHLRAGAHSLPRIGCVATPEEGRITLRNNLHYKIAEAGLLLAGAISP